MKLAVLVIAVGLVGCGTNRVDTRMQAEGEPWRKEAEEAEAQRNARRLEFEARMQAEREARRKQAEEHEARMQAEREARRKQAEEQEAQRNARRLEFEARKTKCNGLSKTERIVAGSEAQQVQESVKDSLKDPWSAYFKNIREVSKYEQCIDNAREGGGYTVYRGLVNSKNSYGGYAGWSAFNIYNSKRVDIYGN